MKSHILRCALLAAITPCVAVGCDPDGLPGVRGLPRPDAGVDASLVGTSDSGDVVADDTTSPTPGDATAETGSVPAPESPVWYGDVQAIVREHCASCHIEGGIAPFPLDDYAAAAPLSAIMVAAIESGSMPPWMPDAECRTYQGERRVSPEELAALRAWDHAGAPAGDASNDLGPGAPLVPDTADIVARPSAAYTPTTDRPDDYRCFLLDATFDQETYVSSIWVTPGVGSIVHHALVFLVDPQQVASVEAEDAVDATAGFECFGGESGGPIAWFVPGAVPRSFQGDEALVVPAGSRLLMQVHYNTLSAVPELDETTVSMTTRPDRPALTYQTIGFPNGSIVIEPGDANSVHVKEISNETQVTWVVREVAGHMHLLGTRIAVEVVRDGAAECLLDIPDWDFNWQQFYTLPHGEELLVRPGDTLRMTCEYDNSAANQPVVNGERQAPQFVFWGEGTLDEMCLSYISVLVPLEPGALPGVCRDFEVCRAGCEDPDDYRCVVDCSFGIAECGDCFVDEFFGDDGCARVACGLQAAGVAECYSSCRVEAVTTGIGVVDCMERDCAEALATLSRCVTPKIQDGTCTASINTCVTR